jgi:hypothetical protein
MGHRHHPGEQLSPIEARAFPSAADEIKAESCAACRYTGWAWPRHEKPKQLGIGLFQDRIAAPDRPDQTFALYQG